jgi:hypothetical protein
MSNLTLTCKESGDFKPHPEGIYPAVCVDVMDLGLVETEFQGAKKLVHKVKITFETEARMDDGKPFLVSQSFGASLHPKANLSAFLSKWRGRPVLPGDSIELQKLIGANCTLVISHQQARSGKTYANIDAVSKATKKVAPSGQYDPAAARQRYADWCSRQAKPATNAAAPQPVAQPAPVASAPVPSKSGAGATRTGQQAGPQTDYDPEVGF